MGGVSPFGLVVGLEPAVRLQSHVVQVLRVGDGSLSCCETRTMNTAMAVVIQPRPRLLVGCNRRARRWRCRRGSSRRDLRSAVTNLGRETTLRRRRHTVGSMWTRRRSPNGVTLAEAAVVEARPSFRASGVVCGIAAAVAWTLLTPTSVAAYHTRCPSILQPRDSNQDSFEYSRQRQACEDSDREFHEEERDRQAAEAEAERDAERAQAEAEDLRQDLEDEQRRTQFTTPSYNEPVYLSPDPIDDVTDVSGASDEGADGFPWLIVAAIAIGAFLAGRAFRRPQRSAPRH